MKKIKRITWVVGLLPVVWLAWLASTGGLGANPITALTRSLGDWALRFLLISLAVTPLRMLTNWGKISGLRRTFGLLTFTYASLHLLSYVGLDQFFDWATLYKDLLKRTYITIGLVSFVLLVPLAVTSADGMVRRLGGARWKALHRIVYVIAPLVILHFWMMIKAGYDRPLLYGMAAGSLLILRLVRVSTRERIKVEDQA